MALKSGLASQIGFKTEQSVGVAITPTLFLPLVDEGIELEKERLESEGIYAGRRVLDSDAWNGGNNTVSGDVGLELTNRGLGVLFKHAFGTVNTTGAGPYTHTFSPGDLSGVSFTAQVGVPGVGGTVHPKTASGCKVASWELACSAGEIATFGMSVLGQKLQLGSRVVTDGVLNTTTLVTSATAAFTAADVGKSISGTGIPTGAYIASVTSATNIVLSAAATATASSVSITIGMALASASLPADIKPLKFNHGTVTIGGSAVNVKAATISGDNGLADDRRFIGDQNIAEPLEADLRMYEGTLDLEFTDLTEWNRYVAGDEFDIVLAFTSGADSVTITAHARYDGGSPSVAGRGIVEQSLPFKVIGDGSDADGITAVLVNGDSSAA